MIEHITSIHVGVKCAELHESISRNEVETATIIQSEISMLVRDMEPDDKIITYFSLLIYRYNMLTEQSASNRLGFSELDALDPYLSFMYFLLKGKQSVYEQQYTLALRSYESAESFLDEIPDNYEKGEFYYSVAELYDQMNQYRSTASYLEKAIEMYSRNECYKELERSASTMLMEVEQKTNEAEGLEGRYKAAIL